jgi:hypothetical protein
MPGKNPINHGGTYKRQPDTTHAVSYWHIPGGCDYINALAVDMYFSNEAKAVEFTEKHRNPPEMAILKTIEEHDVVRARFAKHGVKKRQQR